MYLKSDETVFRRLDEGQIRLIQLQPGPTTAPIECRLEEVFLKNATPYTALSYVWGSPEPVNTAFVNDKAIPVAANLYSALLHVRQESSEVTLWVDALCIFQDDKLEKNQQVQVMGDIFRLATSTFIWLGEASENDQVVIDYLCKQHNTEYSDLKLEDLSIAALQHFFGRPWFHRLWILQEAVLSRKPVVHYGHLELPLSNVIRLSTDLIFDNLGNHRGDVFTNCPLRHCMHEWDLLQEVVHKRGGWPLIYALPMTEQMENTLFEDRVYALLGLATPEDRQSIEPDYFKPLEDLQRELSAHLISSSVAPLEALHSMGVRIGSEVPSWGRNWTVPASKAWFLTNPSRRATDKRWSMLPEENKTRAGYEWLNVEASKKPWAIKTSSKIGSPFVRFSEDLWTCAVRGVSVDYVDHVYIAPEGEIELMRECEKWKDVVVHSATAWPTPRARVEAFCKALCRGSYRGYQGNHYTECHRAYEAWIKGLDWFGPSELPSSGISHASHDFGYRVKMLCLGRSFIITKKGFLGLAPGATRPGDMICNFESCNDPFILRSLPNKPTSGPLSTVFIGDTAVVELMDGEGLRSLNRKDVVEYWIQ